MLFDDFRDLTELKLWAKAIANGEILIPFNYITPSCLCIEVCRTRVFRRIYYILESEKSFKHFTWLVHNVQFKSIGGQIIRVDSISDFCVEVWDRSSFLVIVLLHPRPHWLVRSDAILTQTTSRKQVSRLRFLAKLNFYSACVDWREVETPTVYL